MSQEMRFDGGFIRLGVGVLIAAVLAALPVAWFLLLYTPAELPGPGPGPVEAGPSGPKPLPESTSLRMMARRLDAMSAGLEDRNDVKCWTTFKQLETFVAGCSLSPQTTHLKAEVVLNYLDQVWKRTAAEGPPIDAERFDRVAGEIFPSERAVLHLYTLKLGESAIEIPVHDVYNYKGTVEPIRMLQTLAAQTLERDPDRAWLTAEAIESALHLAALLSTAVLKESNRAARRNQHAQILDRDVLEVDRRMAEASGLEAYDPARRPRAPVMRPAATGNDRATMLVLVRQKIRSLNTFNTNYSRDRLGGAFDADLAEHEAEWARVPVDEAASKAHKRGLVELAAFLYRQCALQHPGSDPLTGRQMLKTILVYYPMVTAYDGFINLYPNEDNICNVRVQEFQADALRDSGWHWRALEIVLLGFEAAKERLPALDPYAMEELTEFTSVYAVAWLKVASEVAARRGSKGVTPLELRLAREAYGINRDRQFAESLKAGATTPTPDASFREAAEEARRNLQAVYVDAFFTDFTRPSGITFVHESSEPVLRYRFSGEVSAHDSIALRVRREWLAEFDLTGTIPDVEIGLAGGGVAVADVDGDGLLDIYLVNGKKDRLYRNLGELRFVDVTDAAGLDNQAEGRAAYFVDYDNDGDQDLFVTQVHAPNRLWRNRGDGTFEDVTRKVGLPPVTNWISHSAVWFDYDNDGRLDLYVGIFGNWLEGERPTVSTNCRNAEPNHLFRNTVDGFEDVTDALGVGDVGWTHAVSHFDADGDGWQDLYLANDFGRDVLLINEKGKRFVDATPGGIKNEFLHGMSVGFTDINGDGIEDVYISNIAMFSFISKYIMPKEETRVSLSYRTSADTRMIENNMFLVSGGGSFDERLHTYFDRSLEGCGWAWDADFFDFDNDGQEDLYIVNGREENLSYNGERNVLFQQHAKV